MKQKSKRVNQVEVRTYNKMHFSALNLTRQLDAVNCPHSQILQISVSI